MFNACLVSVGSKSYRSAFGHLWMGFHVFFLDCKRDSILTPYLFIAHDVYCMLTSFVGTIKSNVFDIIARKFPLILQTALFSSQLHAFQHGYQS